MHQPVMTQHIIDLFTHAPQPMHFLDATFGRGGHSRALLDAFPECKMTAIDRDPEAISYAKKEMAHYKERFSIAQCRFSMAKDLFQNENFSGILMDIGVSSPQIDQGNRGFSIQKDGPLDMRMDPTTGMTAADFIHSMKEKELADLIFHYGQETNSRRIARKIIDARHKKPITSTQELSQIILKATPYRRRLHPATKTFQALRIAVNDELSELETFLSFSGTLLRSKGILCVICFHSLEDRIVKNFFKTSTQFFCAKKKPSYPERSEVIDNIRSRSARLRFGVKIS